MNTNIVEIVNFAVVDRQVPVKNNVIYRGGQPVTPGAWRALKTLGVKTIIKLNYPSEGVDDGAVALGMSVVDCKMPPRDFWQALGRPDWPDIDNAVERLTEAGPIFIHCLHGQDRTGLIVGIWRVKYDGWTCQQAYREMLAYGFHSELHDLHEAWENFVAIH